MGLYKRGETWWVQYKGERFSTGMPIGPERNKRKQQALEVYHKRVNEILEGVHLERRQERTKTLRQLLERYMAEHGKHLASAPFLYNIDAQGKVCGYAARLYDFFKPDAKLITITSDRVAEYKLQRRQDGLKPASVNRELSLLRGAFELAIHTWKWARVNPVSEAGLILGETKRVRWLGEYGETEAQLREACPAWLWHIAELVLHTGLRLDEVVSLKWNDVNIEGRKLTVVKSKNGEVRSIPLDDAALRVLEQQIPSISTSPVFYNKFRKPYGKDYVSREFTKAVKNAGIKDFRFHDVRHTFASRLVQHGVDLYTVQLLLGHKSSAMTQRYSHHNVDSLRQAMQMLQGTKSSQYVKAQVVPV